MSAAVYLETSVLLRVFLDQPEARVWIDRLKSADRIITSRLTRLEAERALIRLALDEPSVERKKSDLERGLRELWTRVDFVEIDGVICELAGRLAPRSRLRTLDAIHLATYRWLRERDGSIEMLTCDQRLQAELGA